MWLYVNADVTDQVNVIVDEVASVHELVYM